LTIGQITDSKKNFRKISIYFNERRAAVAAVAAVPQPTSAPVSA
jgi:hypothetical protein